MCTLEEYIFSPLIHTTYTNRMTYVIFVLQLFIPVPNKKQQQSARLTADGRIKKKKKTRRRDKNKPTNQQIFRTEGREIITTLLLLFFSPPPARRGKNTTTEIIKPTHSHNKIYEKRTHLGVQKTTTIIIYSGKITFFFFFRVTLNISTERTMCVYKSDFRTTEYTETLICS